MTEPYFTSSLTYFELQVRLMVWKDQVYLDYESFAEAFYLYPFEFVLRHKDCEAFEWVPFEEIDGGLGINADKLDFLLEDAFLQCCGIDKFVEEFRGWLANNKEALLAEDKVRRKEARELMYAELEKAFCIGVIQPSMPAKLASEQNKD